MKKNPNNTGSIWCAKNVKGWGNTTHFDYYKEDPQVALGGLLVLCGGTILAVLGIIWVIADTIMYGV